MGLASEEQNYVKEAVLSYEPLKNSCILKEWHQIIMNTPIYYDTLQKISTAIGDFFLIQCRSICDRPREL